LKVVSVNITNTVYERQGKEFASDEALTMSAMKRFNGPSYVSEPSRNDIQMYCKSLQIVALISNISFCAYNAENNIGTVQSYL
jgi:hypothetical protein